MFYIKPNGDHFIELLTQYEFDAPEPQFDDRLFGENPLLGLVPVEIMKHGRRVLVLQKHTGSWCFLEADEYAVYSTFDGRKLSDLLASLPHIHRTDLKELIVRLYWLGLLRINDHSFFEPDDLSKKTGLSPDPVFTIIPTNRCNLECAYCYAGAHPSRRESMDWTTAVRILDLIMAYPSESLIVELTGGESFLEADLVERIVIHAGQRAREGGKLVTFRAQTNGTLLTPTLVQRIEELQICITLSLDGDRTANDLTRVFPGNKSSYDAVARTISMFEEKNLPYGVLCVVSKANYGRFKQILDHFSELGLTQIKTIPVSRLGRAQEKWHSVGLKPEEYLEMHLDYLDHAMNRKCAVVDGNIFLLLEKLAGSKRNGTCEAGRRVLAFNPDGTVSACQRYRNNEEARLGNVWDLDGLRGLGNSNPLVARFGERQASSAPECLECAYQRFCGANRCPMDSYLHYGSTEAAHSWCTYLKSMYRELFGRLAEGTRILDIFHPSADVYDKRLFRSCSEAGQDSYIGHPGK